MPLTPAQVEAAFVATAHAQENGGPFNWRLLTDLLNKQLADQRYARAAAFILREPSR